MFAPPVILLMRDAVFWRANKAAFDIKQCFENGFGIVHVNPGADAHQKRQIFNTVFPVFIQNSLGKQIHGGRTEGCQTENPQSDVTLTSLEVLQFSLRDL